MTSATGRPGGEDRFALGLTVVFALTVGWGLAHHEMWLDELQSWLIARDADGLVGLWHNLRYEGHPGLWHLILFAVTRATRNPGGMQVIQGAIATSGVYLMARFAPWPRGQRVLAAFGYFTLYEYGVISRSYGLGELLLFSLCALWGARRTRPGAIAVLLVLLANTSVFGLFMAGGYGLALLVDMRVGVRRGATPLQPDSWRRLLGWTPVVLGGWALAVVQMLVPADSRFAHGWNFSYDFGRLMTTVALPWRAFVPVANFTTKYLWDTGWPLDTPGPHPLALGGGVLILVVALAIVARRPAALALLGSGTLAMVFLDYTKHSGQVRHVGNLVLLFLAAWWLAEEPSTGGSSLDPTTRWVRQDLVTAALLVQVGAGLFLYREDLRRPFSQTRAAADFIESKGWQNQVVVGDMQWCNYAGPPLSAWLGHPLPYLQPTGNRLASFIVWDGDSIPRSESPQLLLRALSLYMRDAAGDVVLALDHSLPLAPNQDVIREVGQFRDSMARDEWAGCFLYYVRKDRFEAAQSHG